MSEWKTYRLGDLCSRIKSGKGIPASEVSTTGEYPVIGGNGIRGYTNTSNFNGVCAVVGRQGAYCGNVRFFSGEAYMTEHAVVIVGNELADTRYLAYLLSIMQLGHLSAQSAQPGLSVQTLSKLSINIPDISTQRRIAGILGSLDDKIELNRRINANLEAQAQALFRSWFVDFEPFRDGPFVDSELGKIPQGWKVGTFQDIINITSGKRPPLKVDKCTSEAYIPIYGASSIQAYTTSFLRNEDLLLIGRVGTLGIVQKVTGLSWPSDNTLIITSPFYEYSYQILKTIDFNKLNRGSTQPLITQTDIKNQIILLPSNEVLYRYEKISANMFSLNKKNNSEIKTLSALRDTLLPKLMAGEIKI